MDRAGVPVIAGLAIGIAFVVLFSVMFQASSIKTNNVSVVTIPAGASMPNGNFEPEIIKVIIGVNNTVRWVNEDSVPSSVTADNKDDPAFSKATNNGSNQPNTLSPNETFQFTFTKEGEFSYHSEPHPWMRGTVVVLKPGDPDDRYRELVEENLKQEIENTPLTLYVDKSDSTVRVNAVQSFVLDNSNSIDAYLVYPTWNDGRNPDAEALTDRHGNKVPHSPILHLADLPMFDAVCPYTETVVGQDGSVNSYETNKETTVYYGSEVYAKLDSNTTGILHYSYSLGTVEPDENGIYRLTFVTPYEAKVELSDELNMLSFEMSGCAATNSDLAIPYFDVMFKIDDK